jgi:hypothetical protein
MTTVLLTEDLLHAVGGERWVYPGQHRHRVRSFFRERLDRAAGFITPGSS